MKTFKQILDKCYGMNESEGSQSGFDDYTEEQKNACLLALDEIWEAHDYPFKDRSYTLSTVTSTVSYVMPYGKIKDSGLKESTSTRPMAEVANFDNLSVSAGKPYYYSLENNSLNLYPTPDAVYTVNVKYLTDYKATDGAETPVEKDTLVLETDVLNVPDYIETHFITTLAYKTALNYNSQPVSDEEYQHWLSNYNTALGILKSKSNRSASVARFVI